MKTVIILLYSRNVLASLVTIIFPIPAWTSDEKSRTQPNRGRAEGNLTKEITKITSHFYRITIINQI
jgi:hypothetical protein